MNEVNLTAFKKVIILPCFEDIKSLDVLIRKIDEICGPDFCVVIIDDGSVKEPVASKKRNTKNITLYTITLKKNYGNQIAIFSGICFVSKRCNPDATIVIMDSDGEDKPENINELITHLEKTGKNVAVASRKQRHDGLKFKVFYQIYKFIFRITTGQKISFGNFMAMDTTSLARLATMNETSMHLPAALIASKLEISFPELERGLRYHGNSKMNLTSLTLHGFRGIMVFSDTVLVRLGLFCSMLLTLCFLAGCAIFLIKFLGLTTPGWASVAVGILSILAFQFGSVILISLMLFGTAPRRNITYVDGETLIKDITKK